MQDSKQTRAADARRSSGSPSDPANGSSWARPSFEVIALDCEITAYAPDGDFPLF